MADETGVKEEVVEQPTQEEAPATEAEQPETEAQESSSEQDENINNQEAPKENAAWAEMRVKAKKASELEAENQKLKSALEESGIDAEYLEQLNQLTQNQNQDYKPAETNLTPDTDLEQVTGTINQTAQTTQALYQEVQKLKQQRREQEDREAITQFPELAKDANFQAMVAEKRLANEVMGRHVPTAELARQVKKQLDYYRAQAQAQTQQETQQRTQQKQQATAQPQTTTSSGQSTATNEELAHRVRKGDANAITERNKALLGDLFD